MEEVLRELRHAADGFDAEVAEGGNGPGVLVFGHETAAVCWGVHLVQHELSVGFDGVDAAREEEFVEVVVHAVHIVFGYDAHVAAAFFGDGPGFVVAGNLAAWVYASPVTEESMPHGDVLDVRVLTSDLCGCVLQTFREASLVGLEVRPAEIQLV